MDSSEVSSAGLQIRDVEPKAGEQKVDRTKVAKTVSNVPKVLDELQELSLECHDLR